MRQRTAGQKRHVAVVMVFDLASKRPTQARAVVQVMRHAQRRHRHHFEMLIGIHVTQWHQGAVFGCQRGVVMRQCFHAMRIGHLRQQAPQLRIARRFKLHEVDEVRQFVAGVVALEMRRAVDVVIGVDQPMRVKHHQGVHAQRAAAAADFFVTVDRVLACAVARSGQLTQVHAGHMGDLGGEGELTHVVHLSSGCV